MLFIANAQLPIKKHADMPNGARGLKFWSGSSFLTLCAAMLWCDCAIVDSPDPLLLEYAL